MTLALRELVDKTKVDVTTVVRATAMKVLQSVLTLSPVGNPDTWKANSNRFFARENYNALTDLQNARAVENPANYTRRGNLRRGTLKPRKSVAALRKAYPNATGKGYVGGRFRANWQVGLGFENLDTTAPPDKSGNSALERGKATINNWQIGSGTLYVTNSLPYAQRLEYGYSKQAPTGMVRITVQDFNIQIQQSIREVKR